MLRGVVPLLGLAACAPRPDVTRIMNEHVVVGPFIEPERYAAFLRGALAEEEGHLPQALRAYAEAASDARDPLVESRIGNVLCQMDPKDPRAQNAFTRALSTDPTFESAIEARARCAHRRGDDRAAWEDASQASTADPLAISPEILLSELEAVQTREEASRDRLVALSLLHGASTTAWESLAAWGSAHHDPMLVARALAAVARLAPSRKGELADRVLKLAGDGELFAARTLAAALIDSPGDRSSGGEGRAPASIPLVARLAVDEALMRHDGPEARLRATRAHLGLDIAAARALLMGDATLAQELAEPVVLADPYATGARMVLATATSRLGAGDLSVRALDAPRSGATSVVVEALLPFLQLVERVSSADVACRMLETWFPSALLEGDALVTPLAVELAARGVLPDSVLPRDARVELASRRSGVQSSTQVLPGSMDARHVLFAWALDRPLERATLELAQRLAPAASHDPLIAVAIARLSLAEGRALSQGTLDRLLAVDPADPIVASAVLDLAKRTGDARTIAPARARLTALARTPGERAHASE